MQFFSQKKPLCLVDDQNLIDNAVDLDLLVQKALFMSIIEKNNSLDSKFEKNNILDSNLSEEIFNKFKQGHFNSGENGGYVAVESKGFIWIRALDILKYALCSPEVQLIYKETNRMTGKSSYYSEAQDHFIRNNFDTILMSKGYVNKLHLLFSKRAFEVLAHFQNMVSNKYKGISDSLDKFLKVIEHWESEDPENYKLIASGMKNDQIDALLKESFEAIEEIVEGTDIEHYRFLVRKHKGK
jgi:hypothetical protein